MLRYLALLPLLVLLPGRGHVVLDPPTGADDVLIRVSSSPGMGTMESFFGRHPDLVVAGDGTVYRYDDHETGLETFQVGHDTMLRWLREADDRGLLDRTIHSQTADGLMDAGSTALSLDAGRVQRRHYVYGLGERSGFRGMAGYVDAILDWAADQPATPYHPTRYRVLVQDDDGEYHCTTSDAPVAVGGPVTAVAALLPGDHCEWDQ